MYLEDYCISEEVSDQNRYGVSIRSPSVYTGSKGAIGNICRDIDVVDDRMDNQTESES